MAGERSLVCVRGRPQRPHCRSAPPRVVRRQLLAGAPGPAAGKVGAAAVGHRATFSGARELGENTQAGPEGRVGCVCSASPVPTTAGVEGRRLPHVGGGTDVLHVGAPQRPRKRSRVPQSFRLCSLSLLMLMLELKLIRLKLFI